MFPWRLRRYEVPTLIKGHLIVSGRHTRCQGYYTSLPPAFPYGPRNLAQLVVDVLEAVHHAVVSWPCGFQVRLALLAPVATVRVLDLVPQRQAHEADQDIVVIALHLYADQAAQFFDDLGLVAIGFGGASHNSSHFEHAGERTLMSVARPPVHIRCIN